MSSYLPSIILILCIFAPCSFATPPIQNSPNSQNSQKPLSNVSYASVLKQAKGTPSKIISYGDDSLQYGELWLPNHSKQAQLGSKPLIVFIHGGCWLNAYDIKHTQAASDALSQAGFAVWSLEYRRTGDVGGAWPGSYQDILQGIEYTKQLSQFNINQQQILLMGHSAGGHLAILAANHYDQKADKRIKGVIGLAAISDIAKYAEGSNDCQTATPRFMGGTYQAQQQSYDAANPIKQGFHPNTILIHGDQDSVVPLAQSTDSGQKVVIVKGGGHFDMIHPGSKAWITLLKTIDELSR
ncbi:MAG: acetyl esterase/lipase [Phenylobacterium sp.]|jgi:acetyl esterase/lipase